MPGLVKAGRTQSPVNKRLRALYTTGVPSPFVTECTRFFIDCFQAEQRLFTELQDVGRRCGKREFFEIDKFVARNALDKIYRNQNRLLDPYDSGCDTFEALALETFQYVHQQGQLELAEQVVFTLRSLPSARRQEMELVMLEQAMAARDERFCIWLVSRCGVDPEAPIRSYNKASCLLRYHLTAHEYAVFLGLESFERYLNNIGCDIGDSSSLCYIIDTLINGPSGRGEGKLIEFAENLLKRNVDLERVLNVNFFAEAPRLVDLCASCRFDAFPRNSNLTCREVVAKAAVTFPFVAKLHKIMCKS
jgi:hypothetical protein